MKKIGILFALAASLFIGAAVASPQATDSVVAGAVVTSVLFIGSLVVGKFAGMNRGIAMTCGAIAVGLNANCTTKPVANLEVDVYIMNRADIDLTTTSGNISGRLISAIAMKSGKYVYKYTGLKTSNSSLIQMAKGKYSNNWIHSLAGIIFDNTAETKENIIEQFAQGNFVAVVRNKWKGTDSDQEFEVLGWDVGLTADSQEKKSDDADTQGAWKQTLKTQDGEVETNAGYILWSTDQTTTLTALEALLLPASS
jgi:hypothetical protein